MKRNYFYFLVILSVLAVISIILTLVPYYYPNFETDLAIIFNIIPLIFLRDKIINQFLLYVILTLFSLSFWNYLLKKGAPYLSITSKNTFKILGRLIIIPFFSFAYLNQFEVFAGSLLGSSALLGIIIGFSAKNTIGNIFAGIYILGTRPFEIGDYVFFPNLNVEGIVKEVTLNYTLIDLPKGNTLLITNNDLLNQEIVNLAIKETGAQDYLYPLNWGLSPSEKHQLAIETIEKVSKKFEKDLLRPVTWFVSYFDRLERRYQINRYVNRPKKLLGLPQDFLISLSEEFEILKKSKI